MKRLHLAAALLALSSSNALAHEKWFYQGELPPLRWDLFFQPLPLAFTGAVALIIGLAWFVWRSRNGRDFVPGPQHWGAETIRRQAFYGLVPAILGMHIAVPLLVNGVLGRIFSPNNVLPGAWAHWLGLLQTIIAICLFYGVLTRVAALALAAVWVAGIAIVGLEPMLDNLHYLGFAGLFWACGRGPIAVDRLLLPRFEPSPALMVHGMTLLRFGVGLSLAAVGFTEKLANIPMSIEFLNQYPLINFSESLGIGMSHEVFALFAGAVEVLAGVLIAFGIFPRTIILVALLPLNLSLTVFNWVELIGHLPLYGSLAIFLIWTPEDRELWLAGLRQGPLAIAQAGRPLPEEAQELRDSGTIR